MTHHFESGLAEEIGLDLAIIATRLGQHQAMLLAEGDGELKSDADGRTWSRHTTRGLMRVFTWWTEKQIRSRMDKAVASGLLVQAAHSGAFDQGSWYAFSDQDRFVSGLLGSFTEEESSPQTVGAHHLPKRADGVAQTGNGGETEGETIAVSACETTSAQTGRSSCPNGQSDFSDPENSFYGSVKSYKEQILTSRSSTETQFRPTATAEAAPEAETAPAAGAASHESVDSVPQAQASSPRKRKRRSKPTFAPDTWQFKAAMKAIKLLHRHGVLAPYVAKRGSAKVAAEWADTFDKLHRLDNYAKTDIYEVLVWLDDPDNWWIESGALQSFSNKVRTRKNDEPSKWDQMYVKQQKTRSNASARTIEARAQERKVGHFE